MIIRFWGLNSRLQSVAYQGASETDLDSDSDEELSHNSHEFFHQHTQGAKTSLLTTMTKKSLQSTFSIDRDLETTMLLLTLWRIIKEKNPGCSEQMNTSMARRL
jgi:hypothetical protein